MGKDLHRYTVDRYLATPEVSAHISRAEITSIVDEAIEEALAVDTEPPTLNATAIRAAVANTSKIAAGAYELTTDCQCPLAEAGIVRCEAHYGEGEDSFNKAHLAFVSVFDALARNWVREQDGLSLYVVDGVIDNIEFTIVGD